MDEKFYSQVHESVSFYCSDDNICSRSGVYTNLVGALIRQSVNGNNIE